MSNDFGPPRQSVLFSFRFIGISLLGSLAAALVSTLAPLPAQISMLGALLSVLSGLFISYMEQEEQRDEKRRELFEKLGLPLALAPEHELFDHYSSFGKALTELARQTDPVLRQYALLKLASISDQVQALASGKVVFSSTETWRTVYEQILQRPGLKRYRSVAWVKTRDYWQDQPGRQSMRVNYELVKQGLEIDRIAILRAELWPLEAKLPSAEILPWIEEQHERGFRLWLVRESDLAGEPDLLSDFGIYGERATGISELDEQSRTIRFTLLFDPQSVKLAQDRWARLSLYAKPYEDLVQHRKKLPPPRAAS